jgi:hypothetical protein
VCNVRAYVCVHGGDKSTHAQSHIVRKRVRYVAVEGTCTRARGVAKGSGRLRAQGEGKGVVKEGWACEGPSKKGVVTG